jgi:hypothetical protein
MVAGELQTQYPVELKAAGEGQAQVEPLATAGKLQVHDAPLKGAGHEHEAAPDTRTHGKGQEHTPAVEMAGELQTQYPNALKAAGGGHVQEDPLVTAGKLQVHVAPLYGGEQEHTVAPETKIHGKGQEHTPVVEMAGELQTQYPEALKAAGGGHMQKDPLVTAGKLQVHAAPLNGAGHEHEAAPDTRTHGKGQEQVLPVMVAGELQTQYPVELKAAGEGQAQVEPLTTDGGGQPQAPVLSIENGAGQEHEVAPDTRTHGKGQEQVLPVMVAGELHMQ